MDGKVLGLFANHALRGICLAPIPEMTETDFLKQTLADLMDGGFAPVAVLLREFDHQKAGIVLEGLPYSVWSLLGHMQHRQCVFLGFLKKPEDSPDLWPKAFWPENTPPSEKEWLDAIAAFESDLEAMKQLVINSGEELFHAGKNGKSMFWAVVANLQHNAYHIGQIKAIGRQLGVW